VQFGSADGIHVNSEEGLEKGSKKATGSRGAAEKKQQSAIFGRALKVFGR
jgi:hypothetical protein